MNPRDFDFIVNNPQPVNRGPFKDKKQQTLALVGFFAIILIVGIVVFNLLFSSGGAAEKVIPLNQRQQNLLTILEKRDTVRDRELVNDYNTLYYSVLTDKVASDSYLSSNEIILSKLPPETLAKYSYSDFESDLSAAQAINKEEEKLIEYIDKALNDYRQELIDFQPETEKQKELLDNATQNLATYLSSGQSSEESSESE